MLLAGWMKFYNVAPLCVDQRTSYFICDFYVNVFFCKLNLSAYTFFNISQFIILVLTGVPGLDAAQKPQKVLESF